MGIEKKTGWITRTTNKQIQDKGRLAKRDMRNREKSCPFEEIVTWRPYSQEAKPIER
jgi:hypothetical protein